MSTTNDVIALVAAQEVITKRIFDDVITFTTEDLVRFRAGVQIIITTIAPKRINALVAD